MPRKCDNCRFYSVGRQLGERCHSYEVRSRVDPDFIAMRSYVELTPAREICDKEHDGIFVYFQPKAETRAVVASVPVEEIDNETLSEIIDAFSPRRSAA